jgi:hypothetical protein
VQQPEFCLADKFHHYSMIGAVIEGVAKAQSVFISLESCCSDGLARFLTMTKLSRRSVQFEAKGDDSTPVGCPLQAALDERDLAGPTVRQSTTS